MTVAGETGWLECLHMLLALQQEIYSFVALFILKYIGKHIEKYRKNTLYSTITTRKTFL